MTARQNQQFSWLTILLFLLNVHFLFASSAMETHPPFRSDCVPATSTTELAVNNVRARINHGGSFWQNENNGGYVVPFTNSDENAVSSIYSGGLWAGATDLAGNLKLFANTYGLNGYLFAGPIENQSGTADVQSCLNWDRFFEVTKTDVFLHIQYLEQNDNHNNPYTADKIPVNIKGWPSIGNPFFEEVHGFSLPQNGQSLAPFHDENWDGVYNPLDGDIPMNYDQCHHDIDYDFRNTPDVMIFNIYNDYGGVLTQTHSDPIHAEVHQMSFAYSSDDAINDMTFYHNRIFNRSAETLVNLHIGLWVDADLGCSTDDYVGCDTSRNMSFVYNQDNQDGTVGCVCDVNNTNTYCQEIPILGIDFLKTPKNPTILYDTITGLPIIDSLTGDTIFFDIETGMSSFTYYTTNAQNIGNPAPTTVSDYYKLLTGGSLTYGGSGNDPSNPATNFAFPSPPGCSGTPGCWSMVDSSFPNADVRTIQSTKSQNFIAGSRKELLFNVMWIPDVEHPFPDLHRLYEAERLATRFFDNCFRIKETIEGPDAPDLSFDTEDNSLVCSISNDNLIFNNYMENYAEVDPLAPSTLPKNERTYYFEGYKVFQLANPGVRALDLDNTANARLIFQSDKQNSVGEIYNWDKDLDGTWMKKSKVNGMNMDQGLVHQFTITEDLFSTGNYSGLVNGKEYYYMAVAYAYNNWAPFDSMTERGQSRPYLEGKVNVKLYKVIPEIDRNGHISITRLDGVGAGSHFLDMKPSTRNKIIQGNFEGRIEYYPGKAPFEVIIDDKDNFSLGHYELTLVDSDSNDQTLDSTAKWKITNLDNPTEEYFADEDMSIYSAQQIPELGVTIRFQDGLEAGNNENYAGDTRNGSMRMEIDFLNANSDHWLNGVLDDGVNMDIPHLSRSSLDFISAGTSESDHEIDPYNSFAENGWMVPYYLLDYRSRNNTFGGVVSPVWKKQGQLVRHQKSLSELNNVDIILTDDKSMWSRCVILEGTNEAIRAQGLVPQGNAEHMFLRDHLSVGKEDTNNDGLPDLDGAIDEAGDAIKGMGWFPGYAIDVETGKRLNIFFAESSIYRCDEPKISDLGLCTNGLLPNPTGADMLWNPTAQTFIDPDFALIDVQDKGLWQLVMGGQHFLYVTNSEYDECKFIYEYFKTENSVRISRALKNVQWTGIPFMQEGFQFKSLSEGLIPSDCIIKLRADNPFDIEEGLGLNNNYPRYQFTLTETSKLKEVQNEKESLLGKIKIVPNPLVSSLHSHVLIINIPECSKLEIFNIDGQLTHKQNNTISTTDYLWDLRDGTGNKVLPGVYLVRINTSANESKTFKLIVQ